MPKKAKAKVSAKLKAKPKAKPVHHGLHTATPYLFVQGAARAIDFYKAAFNAKELMRMPATGGRVGHAQIKIGDSHIMLSRRRAEAVMGDKGQKLKKGPSRYGSFARSSRSSVHAAEVGHSQAGRIDGVPLSIHPLIGLKRTCPDGS